MKVIGDPMNTWGFLLVVQPSWTRLNQDFKSCSMFNVNVRLSSHSGRDWTRKTHLQFRKDRSLQPQIHVLCFIGDPATAIQTSILAKISHHTSTDWVLDSTPWLSLPKEPCASHLIQDQIWKRYLSRGDYKAIHRALGLLLFLRNQKRDL